MGWKPLWPYHQVIWEDRLTYCRYEQMLLLITVPRGVVYFSFMSGSWETTTLHFPLQSTSMAYGKVTEDTVYTCTGHPLRSDIANILDWSLNKDFNTAYKRILLLTYWNNSLTKNHKPFFYHLEKPVTPVQFVFFNAFLTRNPSAQDFERFGPAWYPHWGSSAHTQR